MSTEFVTVLARILTRHGNRVGALLYGEAWTPSFRRAADAGTCCTSCTAMLQRPQRAQSRRRNLHDLLRTALTA